MKQRNETQTADEALADFIDLAAAQLDMIQDKYKTLAMDAKLSIRIRMLAGQKSRDLIEFKRRLRHLGD